MTGKGTFLLVLFFTAFFLNAKAQDTLHVTSHNKAIIVTDPSTGTKTYPSWVTFPSQETAIRKIILHVNFACPDSMRCADWDYLDRITIRRKGGIKGDSLNYEIGRMLTPYGGAFGKNWGFEWTADITDFSLVLRDSVEIEYAHSGYEPNEDRGWKITVSFELIKGKPLMQPLAIHKIYDGHFRYGESAEFMEKQLPPVSIKTNKNSTFGHILIFQTGHGMDSSGCGEFCSRYREVWFDGKLIDKRDIWMECSDNPLYPQAGTWIFDRANWCPGKLQHPDILNLGIEGSKIYTVDLNMEPYKTKDPNVNEAICAYFVEYGNVAANEDISIEDIIVPSSKKIHSRKNPSCSSPSIIIKNNGKNTLKTFKITYGTKGFPDQEYNWTGSLAFNQEITVDLPGIIQTKEVENTFSVKISAPNGKKDAFLEDNYMESSFEKTQILAQNIILQLQTNLQPAQNALVVKNSGGEIVHERKLGSLAPNTEYRDTLKLKPDCYELILSDTANDGLEFWFNTEGGRGFFRILNDKSQLIKKFESDFGKEIHYFFSVSEDAVSTSQVITEPAVGLYPTYTTGKTTLDYFSNEAQDVKVQIVADPGGEIIKEYVYEDLKEGIFNYDLTDRGKQRYYMKLFIEGELMFNKRLRVTD